MSKVFKITFIFQALGLKPSPLGEQLSALKFDSKSRFLMYERMVIRMAEYRKGAHTVYDIQYHFVWITKYRYHVLVGGVGLRARDLLRQGCESRNIKILKGHVSKDHIHILASCPPKLSPAKIMQYLKGYSSRKLQQEFPSLKKRYWGNHLWARGYFCATTGSVTQSQIKQYIESHNTKLPNEEFTID